MDASYLWNELRHCWIDVNIGTPKIIKHGAGNHDLTKTFQQQTSLLSIKTNEVPDKTSSPMSVVVNATTKRFCKLFPLSVKKRQT